MKVMYQLFILFFFTVACNGQEIKELPENNDLKTNKLFGEVKTVKEIAYKMDTDQIFGASETNYNSFGFITSVINKGTYEQYNPDISNVYNQDVVLIETLATFGSKRLKIKTNYQYISKEKIIKTVTDNFGKHQFTIFNRYDKSKQLIETKIFTKNKLSSQTLIQISKNNEKNIEEIYYNASGEIEEKINSKFDKTGNLIKKIRLDRNGIEMANVKFQYDGGGNAIKETHYYPNGDIEYEISSRFELDKNGNWIKKTDFVNELIDSIVERKFEYY